MPSTSVVLTVKPLDGHFTQEETRQALLLFEEQLASWGYALSDVFEGDTLDTVNMILRGNR